MVRDVERMRLFKLYAKKTKVLLPRNHPKIETSKGKIHIKLKIKQTSVLFANISATKVPIFMKLKTFIY